MTVEKFIGFALAFEEVVHAYASAGEQRPATVDRIRVTQRVSSKAESARDIARPLCGHSHQLAQGHCCSKLALRGQRDASVSHCRRRSLPFARELCAHLHGKPCRWTRYPWDMNSVCEVTGYRAVLQARPADADVAVRTEEIA